MSRRWPSPTPRSRLRTCCLEAARRLSEIVLSKGTPGIGTIRVFGILETRCMRVASMATSPKSADIGLIGLAVMGENLVLNMESHGFTVAVFNRTTSKVDAFVAGRARGKSIIGAHSVQELVSVLERPRKIMIMVKAGPPVDEVINELVP